eukprot:GHVO01032289.1.p1 GENE.GHVO01032289.1~~GHVO01032289.1.p1  ORF type:complete len:547 (+),score=52.34 GHVO01032289.1:22-1641(+)
MRRDVISRDQMIRQMDSQRNIQRPTANSPAIGRNYRRQPMYEGNWRRPAPPPMYASRIGYDTVGSRYHEHPAVMREKPVHHPQQMYDMRAPDNMSWDHNHPPPKHDRRVYHMESHIQCPMEPPNRTPPAPLRRRSQERCRSPPWYEAFRRRKSLRRHEAVSKTPENPGARTNIFSDTVTDASTQERKRALEADQRFVKRRTLSSDNAMGRADFSPNNERREAYNEFGNDNGAKEMESYRGRRSNNSYFPQDGVLLEKQRSNMYMEHPPPLPPPPAYSSPHTVYSSPYRRTPPAPPLPDIPALPSLGNCPPPQMVATETAESGECTPEIGEIAPPVHMIKVPTVEQVVSTGRAMNVEQSQTEMRDSAPSLDAAEENKNLQLKSPINGSPTNGQLFAEDNTTATVPQFPSNSKVGDGASEEDDTKMEPPLKDLGLVGPEETVAEDEPPAPVAEEVPQSTQTFLKQVAELEDKRRDFEHSAERANKFNREVKLLEHEVMCLKTQAKTIACQVEKCNEVFRKAFEKLHLCGCCLFRYLPKGNR